MDLDWLGFRPVANHSARKKTPLLQQSNNGGEAVGDIDALCSPVLLNGDAVAHSAAGLDVLLFSAAQIVSASSTRMLRTWTPSAGSGASAA